MFCFIVNFNLSPNRYPKTQYNYHKNNECGVVVLLCYPKGPKPCLHCTFPATTYLA